MKLAEHKIVALLPRAKKELADRLAFIGLCLKKAQQCSKANAVLPCLTVSRGNFINLIHTVNNAYTNRMHHRGKDTPLILAGVLPMSPPDNKNRQVSVVPSILPPSVASPSLLSKSIVLRTKLQGQTLLPGNRTEVGNRRCQLHMKEQSEISMIDHWASFIVSMMVVLPRPHLLHYFHWMR